MKPILLIRSLRTILSIITATLLVANAASADEQKFTPDALLKLFPDHKGGDKDFDGHGPKVIVRANLATEKEGTEVWVIIYLHMKETQRDFTEAEGTFRQLLYTAPAGKKVTAILSDSSSEAQYTDTNHELDSPAVRGGTLVCKFEVMGDTRGNDVGNHTDDDSYANVYFNEVRLKVE